MLENPRKAGRLTVWGRILAVLALLYFFLLGVKSLSAAFKLLGSDLLGAFFSATENPFIGLMVGVLATTLVQSSSVSTSMIVGLVAAPELPLPIGNAVPMIMGANIGTTVTNTIVSLGHMARPQEFRRAFATATCHDFFNFITVAVLLPLELMTGYLQRSAVWLSTRAGSWEGVDYDSPLGTALKTGLAPIQGAVEAVVPAGKLQGLVLVVIAMGMIFAALALLVRVLRSAVQSRIEGSFSRFLDVNTFVSIGIGAMLTIMVQSSSITTSLLVPLAGAGMITLSQAFPVTVGANLGTTITALMAAMAVSGANAQAGVVIALVHLLFNLTGMLMIMPFPPVRELPIRAATWLADVATRSRRWALVYVLILFYAVPAVFAFLFR